MKPVFNEISDAKGRSMFNDDDWTLFDQDPAAAAELVKRINHVLARNGLSVAPIRPDSNSEDAADGYEFIYGSRAFRLRVGIGELACALGILTASPAAEQRLPSPQVSRGRRYGAQGR